LLSETLKKFVNQKMPEPIDPRKKPANVKVHVSSGAGVDIVWSDDHASHYDFIYLRENCPCATCGDERAKKAAEVPLPPARPGQLLPAFYPCTNQSPAREALKPLATTP